MQRSAEREGLKALQLAVGEQPNGLFERSSAHLIEGDQC
jgi:hypothetical protein